MDQTAVVHRALELFQSGDAAGFVECFARDVTIYGEPAIAQRPTVSSRDELADLVRRRPRPEVTIDNLTQPEADCVIADVVVVDPNSGSGWRLAARISFEGESIETVRLFWQRSSASPTTTV